MSEKEFLRQILQLAKLYGWKTVHFRPALTQRGRWVTAVAGDGKGFPDLILVKVPPSDCIGGSLGAGRIIAAELKAGRNKATAEQEAWLAALKMAGVPAYLWTPKDWPEIERILTS